LPTQHPLQFVESQRDCEHVCVLGSQLRPSSVQSTHAPPLVPQAAASLPARHRERPPSLLQHPLGHVEGPQPG
jgi:hypothetical protein